MSFRRSYRHPSTTDTKNSTLLIDPLAACWRCRHPHACCIGHGQFGDHLPVHIRADLQDVHQQRGAGDTPRLDNLRYRKVSMGTMYTLCTRCAYYLFGGIPMVILPQWRGLFTQFIHHAVAGHSHQARACGDTRGTGRCAFARRSG